MSLTQIGVVLAGVWLLLVGIGSNPSETLSLVFGIAIIVLVFLDSAFVREYRSRS
jgi:hypothetical protein